MKKCPVCQSTTFKGTKKGKRCNRCGYTWKNPTYDKLVFSKEYRSGSVNNNGIALKVDFHNTAYKFKILGDSQTSWPVQKKMRGWVQNWHYDDTFKALKTPNHVIIYLSQRFKKELKAIKDIDTLDQMILTKVKNAAKLLMAKYEMVYDLSNPVAIRKEIKLQEGFKSPLQMLTKNVKVVYPDGTIEFINKDAVKHFKNFFNNMAVMNKVDIIENQLVEHSANLKMHRQVLTDISDAITKQTLILEKITQQRRGVTIHKIFNSIHGLGGQIFITIKRLGVKVLEKLRGVKKCKD